jgi:tetratricopeptide (TPR) repeat protein
MKSFFILLILLPLFSFSQLSDSVKKKAIRLQIQAFEAEQKQQFDSAILFADSSIALNSKRYEPYVIKAESLWYLKCYSEAAETYKKYMEFERPDFLVGAYVLVGMLYDKAGMFNEAKEQYLLAIKTWENGNQPSRFDQTEKIEYVFALGLLGDTKKWKEKLSELINKYPSLNYKQFESMSRQELLEFHFSPFGG